MRSYREMASTTYTTASNSNSGSRSPESEALQLAFKYLMDSIDTASILPAALNAHLISEPQRSECASEPDPYKKAEKFLGLLQRAVNGDSNKYHTFIRILKGNGHMALAEQLHG